MNIANCRLSLFVNSKDAHTHTYSCYYSKDKLELQTIQWISHRCVSLRKTINVYKTIYFN